MIWASTLSVRSYAQANTQGQWSALSTWPTRAIHVTLLPDGRVLFFSFYAESLQPNIWDPVSNTFSPAAAAPYELFCAGHTSLADGRVFLAGGHIADYTGFSHAQVYDPSANTFSPVPDMNQGRWYPTTTVLPNGDVLVTSGDINSNTNTNPLPQVLQMSSGTWRNLTSAQLVLPLYPLMFVAPNGKVFYAGASRQSRYLDTSGTGAWSNVAVTNFNGWRDYGPGVMYDRGKVMVAGGSDPPTATAETIDLNSGSPAWSFTGSMHFPRRQNNAVILPDGKVFIVGGSSGSGFDDSTHPVFPTEMWDPATGQFTVMASIAVYRGYHSTALLLPDGRVLSAGGNVGGPNAQIFSPPYLFAGPQPTIASAPNSAAYGQSVFVGTPDAADIKQVTLLRTGSVTHTFDQSARFMRLSFTTGNGGLNVTMPANGNLAPPGNYMLFIISSAGVPSQAAIVQLSNNGGSTGTLTGTVTNTTGIPLLGASVSAGNANATTAADGTYTIDNLPAGTVTVTASLSGYQNGSTTATISAGSTTTAATIALTPINLGNVTGSVVSSAGGAIAGATVRAQGVSTVTNSGGNYTLNNLPAGAATVTATATGFQAGSVNVTVVTGTTVTAPTITLVSGAGAVSGTVKDSSGAAIAGASVGFGGGTTTTNAAGSYTLSGIPVGTIQLVASATGFQNSTQNVTIQGGVTATANFTLVSGSGAVTGTVKDSSGAAIVGASVGYSGGTTTTNATGNYTLSGVPVGTIQLMASATGFQSSTQNVTIQGGVTVTANFTLAPAASTGTVTGKVTNISTGGVISGAKVSWSGGSATANSSGIYTLSNVTAGSQTITATATGYLARSSTVNVAGGNTVTNNFQLSTAGKLTIKVTAANGTVVSGATVTIKGGVIATTVTGSTSTSGLFTSPWIAIGSYTVTVSKSGHTTQSKSTTVVTGATTTVNFTGF